MDASFLIVGGTTGLGLSAARALARAGAAVTVVGRSEASLEAALAELESIAPGRGAGMTGDASESSTADRAVALCLERFGRFDGLYHVAGGSGRRRGDGPLHEVTDEGVAYTLGLNLNSVIYSNRAAVRGLLDRGVGGSIVNMGSVLGSRPSPRYFSTAIYAATKAAIEGFTKSNAARYAADDIRFNVVAPALVETPMSGRAVGDEAINAFVRTKQPLDGGRIGQPDDLDAVVTMLLSPAGRYITGQVIAVDGGWSVSEGQYG